MSFPFTRPSGGTNAAQNIARGKPEAIARGKPEAIAARFAEQSRQEQQQQQLQQGQPLYGDGSQVIPPAKQRPRRLIRLPLSGSVGRKSETSNNNVIINNNNNVQAQNINNFDDVFDLDMDLDIKSLDIEPEEFVDLKLNKNKKPIIPAALKKRMFRPVPSKKVKNKIRYKCLCMVGPIGETPQPTWTSREAVAAYCMKYGDYVPFQFGSYKGVAEHWKKKHRLEVEHDAKSLKHVSAPAQGKPKCTDQAQEGLVSNLKAQLEEERSQNAKLEKKLSELMAEKRELAVKNKDDEKSDGALNVKNKNDDKLETTSNAKQRNKLENKNDDESETTSNAKKRKLEDGQREAPASNQKERKEKRSSSTSRQRSSSADSSSHSTINSEKQHKRFRHRRPKSKCSSSHSNQESSRRSSRRRDSRSSSRLHRRKHRHGSRSHSYEKRRGSPSPRRSSYDFPHRRDSYGYRRQSPPPPIPSAAGRYASPPNPLQRFPTPPPAGRYESPPLTGRHHIPNPPAAGRYESPLHSRHPPPPHRRNENQSYRHYRNENLSYRHYRQEPLPCHDQPYYGSGDYRAPTSPPHGRHKDRKYFNHDGRYYP